MPTSLTIVVLSKGMTGLLEVCLRELAAACADLPFTPTLVVVDNASPVPIEVETSPLPVSLLRLDRAHSFAAANNLAAERFPSELYLLLNNDVFLHPGALKAMINPFTHPQTGIVGTRLLFPDGTIQHAGVSFGEHPDGGASHLFYKQEPHLAPATLTYPQVVTGACMMTRHRTWNQLNGLNPAYEFGGEDVDYCLRARQYGWRVVCCPGPASLHLEASTPGRVEKDIPSRKTFVKTWKNKVTHDT